MSVIKLFQKIYNWITGLKKYYPAHIFVLSFILVTIVFYSIWIFIYLFNYDLEDESFLVGFIYFFVYEVTFYLSLIIALCVTLYLFFLSTIIKKKIYVIFVELLDNERYNFLFVLTIAFTIFFNMFLIIASIFNKGDAACELMMNFFSVPIYIFDKILLLAHHFIQFFTS